MSEPPLVKVGFRDNDGEVETLWAFDLGDHRYRLDNSPWFQYGISTKDIVEALPDSDGLPMFTRVLEKSGFRTLRASFAEAAPREFLEELNALGCTYEGTDGTYFAIDVPPPVDLSTIASFLDEVGVDWEHADPPYEELHGTL